MARLLLILMLVTTQLLSGSGGSVYLCVRNDGTCCCIDSGPASCTCCDKEDQHEGYADGCCVHEAGSCDGRHHDNQMPESDQSPLLAGDPFGCTHLLISSELPTCVSRISAANDFQRIAQLAALVPSLTIWNEFDASSLANARPDRPPSFHDFILIVVSTVVIRC